MKKLIKKSGVRILVGVVVCSSVIFAYMFLRSEFFFVMKMNYLCKSVSEEEREGCLQKAILDYVHRHPEKTKELFGTIIEFLKIGYLSDDMRVFSPIIHEVGMLFVEDGISIDGAVEICPFSLRGGCLHGVLMEDIDDRYSDADTGAFMNICEALKPKGVFVYENCIHAIGHEFAAKSHGSLNDMLKLCSKSSLGVRDQCLYGVFMEYSKGEAGSGHHSEKPTGKYNLPCSSLDYRYKKICYTSAGFYRQYEAESEPFETTYRFCTTVPEMYQEDCVHGVGGALLFSQAFVVPRAQTVCYSLPDDVKDTCSRSF
jgi:hypothetical protein